MPKRWRIVSGQVASGEAGFGYELLDEQGTVLHRSDLEWRSERAVDDELGRVEDGDIVFLDGDVKGPKHRPGRKPKP